MGSAGPGASPAGTHGGGAGATITGKAKAVVSLLGKYLQKPQEAGWRAGAFVEPQAQASAAQEPRPPAHGALPPTAAHLGRARPLHPAFFVSHIINCAQSTRVLHSWTGHCSPLGCEMQFT